MVLRSLFAAMALLASQQALAADVTLKVIVNVANPVSTLDREALSKIYLKKETRWADGKDIMVLQPASRGAQAAFASQVHQKSYEAVKHYFQQLIFSSRGAEPIEKKDDAAVVAAVAKFPNAIGYVTSVPTDPGVKIVSSSP